MFLPQSKKGLFSPSEKWLLTKHRDPYLGHLWKDFCPPETPECAGPSAENRRFEAWRWSGSFVITA